MFVLSSRKHLRTDKGSSSRPYAPQCRFETKGDLLYYAIQKIKADYSAPKSQPPILFMSLCSLLVLDWLVLNGFERQICAMHGASS